MKILDKARDGAEWMFGLIIEIVVGFVVFLVTLALLFGLFSLMVLLFGGPAW